MRPKQPAAEPPLYEDPAPDLLQDGQEEVFSHKAVERGLAQDPRAIGPSAVDCEDLRPDTGSQAPRLP